MGKMVQPRKLAQAAVEQLRGRAAAMTPSLRVELMQNRQAVVEGCKGVLEYSDSCIRLSSDRLILRFSGSSLSLRTFNSSSAIVEGRIDSLEFM